MLLEPLEKELDLPSPMIEFRNHHWADIQCVSKEYELPFVHIIPVDDSSDLVGILCSNRLTRKSLVIT